MDFHEQIKQRLEEAKQDSKDEDSDEDLTDEVHETNIAREAKERLQEMAEEKLKEEEELENRLTDRIEDSQSQEEEAGDLFNYARTILEEMGGEGEEKEEDMDTLPCPECETAVPVRTSFCVSCRVKVDLEKEESMDLDPAEEQEVDEQNLLQRVEDVADELFRNFPADEIGRDNVSERVDSLYTNVVGSVRIGNVNQINTVIEAGWIIDAAKVVQVGVRQNVNTGSIGTEEGANIVLSQAFKTLESLVVKELRTKGVNL